MLSHGGEDMDRQLVGMGVINGNEFDAAFHKRGNEGQVAGQAVELGDDKPCPLLFAGRERPPQLRAVGALAALDLGELIDQRPPTAVQVVHDGFALRVETQAGFALPIRADAEISDKLAVMRLEKKANQSSALVFVTKLQRYVGSLEQNEATCRELFGWFSHCGPNFLHVCSRAVLARAFIARNSSRISCRLAIASAVYRPCFQACLLPLGAPGDRPPCMRQRPFGIAGDRHGFPLLVRAPQGRPAHRPFRGLLGVHSRYGLHTRAVTVYRDTLSEGFSHFVTSMTAPVASGWSGCRVGLAPTGKRRLFTAHATSRHMQCSKTLIDHRVGGRE